MLPGFRFLFAAIMLSLSILVFGLGATALLRAAHEEFASNPAWHPGPETTFAQQGEAIRPVLALLRVDAAVVEKSSDDAPVAAAATPRPAAEQAAIPRAPAEPEKVAALKPEDSSQPEPAKPEIPVVESPVQEKAEVPGSERTVPDGATAARADAPASVDEMKIAAIEQARSPANEVAPAAETVPAALEPTSAAASPDTGLASTRIATLGGPPVTIGGQLSDKAAGAELESIQDGGAGAPGAPAGASAAGGQPFLSTRHPTRRSAGFSTGRSATRSIGDPLIAAIRPGRSRSAVRRAGPIRPMSRHKARCRAPRARRRRSRSSSRSVWPCRHRRS